MRKPTLLLVAACLLASTACREKDKFHGRIGAFYFLIALIVGANLVRLACKNETVARILTRIFVGAWGIFLILAGVGFVLGIIASVSEVELTFVQIAEAILAMAVFIPFGLYLIYSGYRLGHLAWYWED